MINAIENAAAAPRYQNAAQIAAMFNPPISVRFVRQLQAGRQIPFIKLGGRVYFDPVAVRATIDQHLTVRPRGVEMRGRAA